MTSLSLSFSSNLAHIDANHAEHCVKNSHSNKRCICSSLWLNWYNKIILIHVKILLNGTQVLKHHHHYSWECWSPSMSWPSLRPPNFPWNIGTDNFQPFRCPGWAISIRVRLYTILQTLFVYIILVQVSLGTHFPARFDGFRIKSS